MPDERIEGTGFIVKIIVEELTKEEIKQAMEKTLMEYQDTGPEPRHSGCHGSTEGKHKNPDSDPGH